MNNDVTKPYTFVLGCKVNSDREIPDNMVLKTIPKAKYTVVPVVGEMPGALMKAWNKIWESDIKRTYSGDFEEHTQNNVKIYIAIK